MFGRKIANKCWQRRFYFTPAVLKNLFLSQFLRWKEPRTPYFFTNAKQ